MFSMVWQFSILFVVSSSRKSTVFGFVMVVFSIACGCGLLLFHYRFLHVSWTVLVRFPVIVTNSLMPMARGKEVDLADSFRKFSIQLAASQSGTGQRSKATNFMATRKQSRAEGRDLLNHSAQDHSSSPTQRHAEVCSADHAGSPQT